MPENNIFIQALENYTKIWELCEYKWFSEAKKVIYSYYCWNRKQMKKLLIKVQAIIGKQKSHIESKNPLMKKLKNHICNSQTSYMVQIFAPNYSQTNAGLTSSCKDKWYLRKPLYSSAIVQIYKEFYEWLKRLSWQM